MYVRRVANLSPLVYPYLLNVGIYKAITMANSENNTPKYSGPVFPLSWSAAKMRETTRN